MRDPDARKSVMGARLMAPQDPDSNSYSDDALTSDEDGPPDDPEYRAGRFRGWPDGALRRLRARRSEDTR